MNDDKEKKKGTLPDIFRDVLISGLIVAVIIGGIYTYAQTWPPMVVIESGSMQHSESSQIGVIDAGDLVLVKKVREREDVITYVEGKKLGYMSYGDYGDVIVYSKNGHSEITPVIHRAIVWLEYNSSAHSFDIPELGIYNTLQNVNLGKVGREDAPLVLNLSRIMLNFQMHNLPPHSGFITMGDNNSGRYDQSWMGDGYGNLVEPVRVSWIVGKARGELPWFGGLKLFLTDKERGDRRGWDAVPSNSKKNLITSILIIIAIPLIIDVISYLYHERLVRRADKEDLRAENEAEKPEKTEEEG